MLKFKIKLYKYNDFIECTNDDDDLMKGQIVGLLIVLSGLLEICERRVSEEEWMSSLMLAGPFLLPGSERENVCSVMLAGFVLLLGGKERGCALSCWLALSCCWPVGKWEEEARNG